MNWSDQLGPVLCTLGLWGSFLQFTCSWNNLISLKDFSEPSHNLLPPGSISQFTFSWNNLISIFWSSHNLIDPGTTIILFLLLYCMIISVDLEILISSKDISFEEYSFIPEIFHFSMINNYFFI